jgi:solute:Na+ symporter, SSS family
MSFLDLAIIAVYLLGITLFGLRFRRKQHSLRDYFLADRNIPWWAIALSIVAAETSTLTIISVPGLAYDTNFAFLQLVIGYLVGRVIISYLLLPHFFRGELYTAYQLIDRRYGGRLRSFTAGLFLLTRAAAEGVRVFAVAIVVGIALGPLLGDASELRRDLMSIGIVTLLTLVYTFEGGMAAVIWTDVVQLFIYVGGTLVGLFTIVHLVPGGWSAIHSTAASAGKFRVFDFSPDFYRTYTFWSGVIGGAFLTTASHGTDQLIVQRLLAAKSEAQSKLALLSSGVAVLFQFWLFLLIGATLWVFYRLSPPRIPFDRTDRIFPTFIVSYMPHGVSGILIAAILAAAMSNLSAALNSLSSTTMIDFYLRRKPETPDARRLLLSRMATVAWGCVLFALAILSRHGGKVVELGLSIASVAYGALLGVFLLGVLTRRANESGAMIGMAAGFVTNLYIWQGNAALQGLQQVTALHLSAFSLSRPIPFPWYVPIGSIITFAVGYSCSLLLASQNEHPPRTVD